MQKKIMYSLIAMFISAAATAQQPVFTVTTNNNRLPVKETSFSIAITPDKAGTSFTLYVQNNEKKKIDLQITHPVLGVLVDTSFSSEQLKCRYNFEQIDDGRYKLILTNGKERLVKDFEINTVTKRNLMIL